LLGVSFFHYAVDEKRKAMDSETTDLSPRLAAIVDALPLRPGLRVLEIGCGPGAAERAVARRVGNGHVLAIDRSAKAVEQARRGTEAEITAGRLTVRRVAAEDLELEDGEALYNIAFAVRVGALDGRHPEAGKQALRRIAAALIPGGRLFIDGGDPLREVPLDLVLEREMDVP
jgi:SAM-dependent methyltransferase